MVICRGLYMFDRPPSDDVEALLKEGRMLHAARDTRTGNIKVWYWPGPVRGNEHIVPDEFGLRDDVQYLGRIQSIDDYDKLMK